jgi:MFS family permease
MGMDPTQSFAATGTTPTAPRLAARLRPLRVAVFLQGIAPWVPVEKVFMTGIGFDAVLVATMAAAYALVVPLIELPSGILADRWSRRGMLMIAGVAAMVSVVIGALSPDVTTYIVSAMVLGIYFAMQSGTIDAAVYDTLLEELGGAGSFEHHYGRIQLLNSVALVGSALFGPYTAGMTSALGLAGLLAGRLRLDRDRTGRRGRRSNGRDEPAPARPGARPQGIGGHSWRITGARCVIPVVTGFHDCNECRAAEDIEARSAVLIPPGSD